LWIAPSFSGRPDTPQSVDEEPKGHHALRPATPTDIFVVSQVLELYTSIDKMTATFDISKAREQFPALQQDQVFLDNAGGSQALGSVIDSYVLTSQTP
jgi:hypothetical protein